MIQLKVFLSLESIPDSLFRSDDVKQVLVGLMRDLRGIAMATSRLVLLSRIVFIYLIS